MQAKKQNKNNANIYREFNITRFLWTFCEQWIRAKKARLLNTFRGNVGNAKKQYDHKNPAGRRDQTMPRPPTVDENVTRPQSTVDQNLMARQAESTPPPLTNAQSFAKPYNPFDPPKPVVKNLVWLPPTSSRQVPQRKLPVPAPKKKTPPPMSAVGPSSKPRSPSPVPFHNTAPSSKPRPRSPTPVPGPSKYGPASFVSASRQPPCTPPLSGQHRLVVFVPPAKIPPHTPAVLVSPL